MPVFQNLVGHKYGRWTVLEFAGRRSQRTVWRVRCECGNESIVSGNSMRKGHSLSCGCLHVERAAAAATRHGMAGRWKRNRGASPTYNSWRAAKERCENAKSISFVNYGGRGIRMCEVWSQSFAAFLADMGARPEGKTLDRIDNNRGYEPGNCRWATKQEQNENKRIRKDSRILRGLAPTMGRKKRKALKGAA